MKLKKGLLIIGMMAFFGIHCETFSFRNFSFEEYLNKIEGAWRGQLIGLAYGEHFRLRWQDQIVPFEINDYLRIKADVVKKMNQAIKQTGGRNWTRLQHEFIDRRENWEVYDPQMVPDADKILIELMFLYTLEQKD